MKPENLMLSLDRHIKLIDFGTALITDSSILDQKTRENIENLKSKFRKDIDSNNDEDKPVRAKATFVGTCE